MKYTFPDNNELHIYEMKSNRFELLLQYPCGGRGAPWSYAKLDKPLISDFRTLLKSKKMELFRKNTEYLSIQYQSQVALSRHLKYVVK